MSYNNIIFGDQRQGQEQSTVIKSSVFTGVIEYSNFEPISDDDTIANQRFAREVNQFLAGQSPSIHPTAGTGSLVLIASQGQQRYRLRTALNASQRVVFTDNAKEQLAVTDAATTLVASDSLTAPIANGYVTAIIGRDSSTGLSVAELSAFGGKGVFGAMFGQGHNQLINVGSKDVTIEVGGLGRLLPSQVAIVSSVTTNDNLTLTGMSSVEDLKVTRIQTGITSSLYTLFIDPKPIKLSYTNKVYSTAYNIINSSQVTGYFAAVSSLPNIGYITVNCKQQLVWLVPSDLTLVETIQNNTTFVFGEVIIPNVEGVEISHRACFNPLISDVVARKYASGL